jgi:hypothetical protein
MKWKPLIDKVLNRPEEPTPCVAPPGPDDTRGQGDQRRPRAKPATKAAAKGGKPAAEEPRSTEDQWLRVLEEAEPDHNPYDTYSWELDPGTEERKLKRKRYGAMDTQPPKDAAGGGNPYDTGIFRGSGWDG